MRMVLKHESTLKPKKPSLIHTSQGKAMILPRANNGAIGSLYCLFLSHCSINIILMNAKTLKSIFLKMRARCLKKGLSYCDEIVRTISACISLGVKIKKVKVS